MCAKAPTEEADGYANDILGWVKYGGIASSSAAGFASAGRCSWASSSRRAKPPRSARRGLFWTVIGAIAFVTIYGILNGIVGNGC